MDRMNRLCWCCVVPPASAGEVIAPAPINTDEVKRSLIAKGSALVSLENKGGFGFLISKDLVLTTGSMVPDPEAAADATVSVRVSPSVVSKLKLLPARFFVSNSELDLTLVACDSIATGSVSALLSDVSKVSRQALESGSKVYILGYPRGSKVDSKSTSALGEGRIAAKEKDHLKIQTDGLVWAAGSAGFNEQGQLAFVICDPQQKSVAAADSPPIDTSGSNCKQSAISIQDVCSRLMHALAAEV